MNKYWYCGRYLTFFISDYEQQRKDLLRKYGIDLQDGKVTGRGTKKMSREAVEELMGKPDGDDSDGVFTWREKNRRMVRYSEHDAKATIADMSL